MTEKESFINDALSIFPTADKNVLTFIANFVFHSDAKSTINLFSQGYCYHFATILKSIYQKGEVCWVAPYSHLIWLYNDVPYDINGVYSGESRTFIPEEFLGSQINDFTHIPNNQNYSTTKKDVDAIIFRYHQYQLEQLKMAEKKFSATQKISK